MRDYDLNELLHPAQAFDHPSEVLSDPDLTLNEKRAILASWASDACAIESVPELRATPGRPPVRVDDILDALRVLDQQASEASQKYRRVVRRRSIFRRTTDGDDGRGMFN